jgi:hypothetical protein
MALNGAVYDVGRCPQQQLSEETRRSTVGDTTFTPRFRGPGHARTFLTQQKTRKYYIEACLATVATCGVRGKAGNPGVACQRAHEGQRSSAYLRAMVSANSRMTVADQEQDRSGRQLQLRLDTHCCSEGSDDAAWNKITANKAAPWMWNSGGSCMDSAVQECPAVLQTLPRA